MAAMLAGYLAEKTSYDSKGFSSETKLLLHTPKRTAASADTNKDHVLATSHHIH